MTIKTGDEVEYIKTGERLNVAISEDGRIMPFGWPLELIPVSEVKLVHSCSPEREMYLLERLATNRNSAEWSNDPRHLAARRILPIRTQAYLGEGI